MNARYYSALAEQEYRAMLEAPEKFPVSFKYNGKAYYGFSEEDFATLDFTSGTEDKKETNVYKFLLEDTLKITLDTHYYADYGTYDWTVWFENVSSANSGVLSDVCGADMFFPGDRPVLKGVLGDHEKKHEPYEFDLTKEPASFINTIGRATHITFPYFNLLIGDSGATISLGWGGSWKADVTYENGAVHFKGDGTQNFASYLKPGEKVRSALIHISRYAGRDLAVSVNQRRRWYYDCWMPRQDGKPIAPFTTCCISGDTGKPNSDGSISEDYTTWKPSLEKMYEEKLRLDYRWIDAGWYFDANNETVISDWFGSVGTWELDRIKWPGKTLLESVKYSEEHGSKTLMWFEPERVCHVEALAKNYGYNPAWALGDDKTLHDYHELGFSLNNLGDPACLDWTFKRIIKTMDENGIHMYREDFNTEPAPFWAIGDAAQGENRTGITENLYMQGHYELWDRILADCKSKGKTTFVDICASGGGRNDLESMRRGIPLLRSDGDRTTTALRLSMTTALCGWIPFTGAATKESDPEDELAVGEFDEYIWRCSLLPVFNYGFEYAHNPNLDYDMIRRCIKEWEDISVFFCEDFYCLTPWRARDEKDKWTAFAYYNPDENKGVLQAFRQETCPVDSCEVKLSFLQDGCKYDIVDIDGKQSMKGVDAADLKKGITLKLAEARSAAILYINPCK